MKWKTVARLARLVGYVVVPGAAGYLAYRHVIRPWLDRRARASEEAEAPRPGDGRASEARSTPEHKTTG